jgi:DNA-binding transcriptional regulator LsrR (DeoR family)
MSGESKVVLAHVARLHYVRGMAKQDIAQRLGMSRFKVARVLDEAVAQGIVRFEIAEPVEVDDEHSRALESAFGLDLAVVVPDGGGPDALARAAAAWLPELVREAGALGVAWGSTLQQIADALPAADPPSGVPVVQICGAVPGLEQGTGPAELALRFAERLGGRLYPLPAPALAGRAARDELLRNDAVRPTVELFDALGLALVGIGAAHHLPGAPADAVGHLLVHVYDAAGAQVDSDAADRAIAMSSEQLRRARVVAVAGGAGKEEAILGALRTGLVDTLFTDRPRAAFALEAA